jgi:hypothetical protein
MQMTDEATTVAVNAIIAKRDALLAERAALRKRQTELAARDRQIDRDLADCRAAGRVFGVEVELPKDKEETTAGRFLVDFSGDQGRRISEMLFPGLKCDRTALTTSGEKVAKVLNEAIEQRMPRVRDIVLDRLKAAGADGSKAAAIQAYIESTYSKKIHPKTVGMTLFRLAQEKRVRRQGHTWFIGPESMNPGVAAPGSEEAEAEKGDQNHVAHGR